MHTLRKFKTSVTLEALSYEHAYDAYVSTSAWNGWLVPFFTLAQCEKIIDAMQANGYECELRIEGGRVYLHEALGDEQLQEAINPENPSEILYALGGWSWAWEHKDVIHTYIVAYDIYEHGYFRGTKETHEINCYPEQIEAKANALAKVLADAYNIQDERRNYVLVLTDIDDQGGEIEL